MATIIKGKPVIKRSPPQTSKARLRVIAAKLAAVATKRASAKP
jgi:hypothetical protein